MGEVPTTNMTVVTNYRHYEFELNARPHAPANDKSIVYTLRFQYPEVAVATVTAKTAVARTAAHTQGGELGIQL